MSTTTYMIIERFHPGKVKALYERCDQEGRLLPQGVTYLNSWIDEKVEICFQLMEIETLDLIHQWIQAWDDLADFEIIPIISSAAAKARVLNC